MTDEPLADLEEFSVFVNGVGWYVPDSSKRFSNQSWIEADDSVIRAMYGRLSFEDLAAVLGRGVHATADRCRQLGYTFASLQKKDPKPDRRRGVA